MVGTTPFTVLHVCAANACRSPLAETLMRESLRVRFGPEVDAQIRVVSAGVHATAGTAMEHGVVELLRRRRVPVDPFAAQQLTPELVEAADLVLTATRAQRPEVLRRHPAAARYTFTLVELGQILPWLDADALPDGDLPARARALVATADGSRGNAARGRAIGSELDVHDPSGGSPAAYDLLADIIDGSLHPLLKLLGDPVPVTPRRRRHPLWFLGLRRPRPSVRAGHRERADTDGPAAPEQQVAPERRAAPEQQVAPAMAAGPPSARA